MLIKKIRTFALLGLVGFALVEACAGSNEDLVVIQSTPGVGLGPITRIQIDSSTGKTGSVDGSLPLEFGVYVPSGTMMVTVTVTAYSGDCAVGRGTVMVTPNGGLTRDSVIINPIPPVCGMSGAGGAIGSGGTTGRGGGIGSGGSPGAGGAGGGIVSTGGNSGGVGGRGGIGGGPTGGMGTGNSGGQPLGGMPGGGVAGGPTGGMGMGNSGGLPPGGMTGMGGINGGGGMGTCNPADPNACGGGASAFCDSKCGAPTGMCVPSSPNCPQIYMPVCGCNNQTYGNDCYRIAAHIGKLHDGACTMCDTVRCSNNYVCCPATGLCCNPLLPTCCAAMPPPATL